MAAANAPSSTPVALICGDDDFGVRQRARQLYQKWCAEVGGTDHETIDAAANNSGEAIRALGKLREALQTLPFFGPGKVIWFQNCTFLGDDRTASAQAVADSVGDLAQELKTFRWDNVRLLITAGKVDKRKTFFKTLDKLGTVETLAALTLEDRDWSRKAEEFVRKEARTGKKSLSPEAVGELVAAVGPNLRQLGSEVEKLSLYVGDRAEVTVGDVMAVVTQNKQAQAFALGDALGDRRLPEALRALDAALWAMKSDRKSSEIGLLYGLISKVRVLLFVREMCSMGLLKPGESYDGFKLRLERIPAEGLPEDKRYNPLAMNPYMLFKALPQARNYSSEDLVRAMDLLLDCNRRLVSTQAEEALILQQALVQIISQPARPERLT